MVLVATGARAAELPALPSGQVVTFYERIAPGPFPASEIATHFRFLAPQIARAGGDIGIEQAADDMQVLCDAFALPMLQDQGAPIPERIIINLADRVVPFGQADPQATQFYDAFSVQDGACIWEGL